MKDHNNITVLEEPDALEDLLNINGDPGPEPALPPQVATFLGEQLQAYYAHLMSEGRSCSSGTPHVHVAGKCPGAT